jgi:protein-disulfide isomerase
VIPLVLLAAVAVAQTAAKPAPAKKPAGKTTATKPAAKKNGGKPAASASLELPPRAVGSRNAPITIEVFSDFECPACRELYMGVLRRLIEEYCNANKVYLIHRDFPLPNHKWARDAARLAVASAAVNRYEQVAEAIFENQAAWTASGQIAPYVEKVLSPAEMKKLNEQLTANRARIDAAIENDIFLGAQNQVRQTPTMIIRSKTQSYPTAGVVQYIYLKLLLDKLLSE